MKFTQVFGLIVLVHVGLFGLLLVQSGCQTQTAETSPPSRPDPATTVPIASSSTADLPEVVDPAFNAGFGPDPVSSPSYDPPVAGTPGRYPPTRPVASSRPLPADSASGSLSGSGSDVLMPVLDPSDLSYSVSAGGEAISYEIQPGDSLSAIARRQGVSLSALLAANGLNRDSVIHPGGQLEIPAGLTMDGVRASGPVSNGPSGGSYTVQPGDTLSGIASRHGTTVSALRSANGISGDRINAGQSLRLPLGITALPASPTVPAPRPSNSQPAPSTGAGGSHTVTSGETISGLASRYGVNAQALMDLNGIRNPRSLRIGQVLVLPGREGSAPTPALPSGLNFAPRTVPPSASLQAIPSRPTVIETPEPQAEDLLNMDDLPPVELLPLDENQ